jgi:hypothetical protein
MNWTYLNQNRISRKQSREYGSTPGDGFNGAFHIQINGIELLVIASDGMGWQHVSVSMVKQPQLTPSWPIMCKVKELFWDDEDAVMQLHPPKSKYVNNHPGCLHLWRPADPDKGIPLPLSLMVGFKEENKPEPPAQIT